MDSNKNIKFPRISHLPWSQGVSEDDLVSCDISHFLNKNVIVEEKLDGENSTLTCEKVYARSPDSRDHPSRHWLKKLWSNIKGNIPQDMRICGENLYACHSIKYDTLPSYFIVFMIFDGNKCLSWNETKNGVNYWNLIMLPFYMMVYLTN